MPSWSYRYTERAGLLSQEPVYALVVFEDRTQLGGDLTAAPTTIDGAEGDSMTLRERGDFFPVMVYDADGFELFTGTYDTATNDVTVDSYAVYGTPARTFTREYSTIGVPWLCYSTGEIPEATTLFETGMDMPSGSQQEIDFIEGGNRSQPVTVSVLDTGGRITRQLRDRTIIGKTAMVLGGYEGLSLADFTVLHVGPVTRFSILRGSVYEIEVDTVMVKLKRKLFRDVAAFDTTLSGSMTSGQTTIPLTDASDVYDSFPATLGAKPGWVGTWYEQYWRAAMYFKVDNEYMRHASGTGPVNVTRGCLGTTAASHSSGKTVDMLFVVEGNPINILLGFILTRDPNYEALAYLIPGETTGNNYDWAGAVDDAKAALGLHVEVGDVDVSSFEDVRDNFFPRYFGRIAFSKETDMEKELRESLLKPLGLNLYVNRAGKLALTIVRPPLNAEPVVLDESNVVGIPDIDFTNEEIVNEVTVEYDHDYITGDSVSETTVLDATSQSAYDRAGDCTLATRWLVSDLRGASLAQRLAKKKMRHTKEPNPVLPVEVLFSQNAIDLGDAVQLTLDALPDPITGAVGWDKQTIVTGRRVDWQNGTLVLDLVATAYQKRYCLIAPAAMGDYTAATDAEKAVYGFVAGGTTERMSDNTPPYQIM